MSTTMAIMRACYPYLVLAFLLLPIISCDNTLNNNVRLNDENPNKISGNNPNDKSLNLELTMDSDLIDNTIISSLYQQQVCRRNMVNMVYELCRPYFRAVFNAFISIAATGDLLITALVVVIRMSCDRNTCLLIVVTTI
ncbi:unnamed protein product [Medioppia subpectinata]|uniref:Uncharacterized protein n=1 Tax=Medioppia subpectinata TaxID=1979941 RepID=A0A7R9LDE4_9ACAR|nr:unnamed protein product [Medioppia subpectinata]CAG2117889.1 unnamed protein product [Medioppia subpectinata]